MQTGDVNSIIRLTDPKYQRINRQPETAVCVLAFIDLSTAEACNTDQRVNNDVFLMGPVFDLGSSTLTTIYRVEPRLIGQTERDTTLVGSCTSGRERSSAKQLPAPNRRGSPSICTAEARALRKVL